MTRYGRQLCVLICCVANVTLIIQVMVRQNRQGSHGSMQMRRLWPATQIRGSRLKRPIITSTQADSNHGEVNSIYDLRHGT